jgi:hypothetical protein
MKRTYLKIEYGSRGEMEILGLVETSAIDLQKELDGIVDGCEDDEGMIEYYEEFMHLSEVEERGVIEVCVSEEESYIYVDYEKNKESVDEILRITRLCFDSEMEWSVGDERINDILFELEK